MVGVGVGGGHGVFGFVVRLRESNYNIMTSMVSSRANNAKRGPFFFGGESTERGVVMTDDVRNT